jgi:hypothetical protein
MNWSKAQSASLAVSRGRARQEFNARKRAGRPMTLTQRKYLNALRKQLGFDPVGSGLSVYEASEQISGLKKLAAK